MISLRLCIKIYLKRNFEKKTHGLGSSFSRRAARRPHPRPQTPRRRSTPRHSRRRTRARRTRRANPQRSLRRSAVSSRLSSPRRSLQNQTRQTHLASLHRPRRRSTFPSGRPRLLVRSRRRPPAHRRALRHSRRHLPTRLAARSPQSATRRREDVRTRVHGIRLLSRQPPRVAVRRVTTLVRRPDVINCF